MKEDKGDKADDIDWEEWNPNKISFINHMIAGSFAGLTEHISIFPIDTLKTHLQCQRCGSTSIFQTWTCASNIVRKEGIFRLWRGVSAMFAGCVPAHAAYFSVYETVKRNSFVKNREFQPLQAGLAGALASLSHDLFMNPFDVIKQRMQLGYYNNIYHCIKSIYFKEGIKSFYVSLPTTLLMNVPQGIIIVSVNETLNKIINPTSIYDIKSYLISGALAGATAAFITNPLDVIKTKLQTQNLEPCPKVISSIPNISVQTTIYRNGFDVLIKILKLEGIRGLFRGSLARILQQSPAVAISWTAYETFKSLLGN